MNNIRDINVLIATDYEGLHSDIRTLSKDSNAGPSIHVRLSAKLIENFRLMGVFESSTKSSVGRYDYFDDNPLWIDVLFDCLNLDIGLHDYTIEFVNVVTGDTYYQYFCYRIQSDSPDKPYVYMDR